MTIVKIGKRKYDDKSIDLEKEKKVEGTEVKTVKKKGVKEKVKGTK